MIPAVMRAAPTAFMGVIFSLRRMAQTTRERTMPILRAAVTSVGFCAMAKA